ncbi:GNAT family N-acetyltransferase [Chitinimonas taiwanensis]|uniref:Acetyltransferase (GNAT) domain-containing protein n=1 Tax=Chitinimonas taiwanensis DSM 18899 TaxID=1121279 RepID=A0A1K2H568_9NEIS|nr:GNAT family N-acetyltransferase [Chitinimonas taiwanensis]SFZ70574.1 Acetyltransferase (GNAT) domain-containing protein [Chitinimonas taiwanensis DSM 18899]
MAPSADLHFQDHHEGVDWTELEALFAQAGLAGRQGDKLRRAFLASTAVCYVFEKDRLIGVARAISDGEYHAVIYDVAVHPDYQSQGLGREIMGRLQAKLPVWRVMLVADVEVQGFYQRLGFSAYPDTLARLDWNRLYDGSPTSSLLPTQKAGELAAAVLHQDKCL